MSRYFEVCFHLENVKPSLNIRTAYNIDEIGAPWLLGGLAVGR